MVSLYTVNDIMSKWIDKKSWKKLQIFFIFLHNLLSAHIVTNVAMQEARKITNGKIPDKWYQSIDETREYLEI